MTSTAASTPPSLRLRAKLDLFGAGLSGDLRRFWEGPDLPGRYPLLLRELHAVSRGGIPLMTFARDRALAWGDPVAEAVGAYLTRHVEEERGHADWVLDDLEALGFDRAIEARRLPSGAAVALLGCAYIWVDQHHPVGILGFLAVLEGRPMTVPFLESVIARSGLPREAFRFYLDHARLDPFHGAEIHGLMDELDLSPAQEEAISLCGLQAQTFTQDLLRAVLSAPLPSATKEQA
ncbi:MAG TPA: iron-containing redox enzyme family protein [Holophagaceae bacterium]|nr:iron-containing redox enzyme family protein [Holophagaceae bacterium]